MTILPMTRQHAQAVLQMMRVFYASPAVHTDGSEAVFAADVEACVSGSPYLEGYVFAQEDALCGYAMVAKSFSTEFGKPCKWVEDLYLLPQWRGKGFAAQFFAMLDERYPDSLIRLEADADNARALKTYERAGFRQMPYVELAKGF